MAERDKRFNMVMTKQEFSLLKKLAVANGMSASDMIRYLLHKEYREFVREKKS